MASQLDELKALEARLDEKARELRAERVEVERLLRELRNEKATIPGVVQRACAELVSDAVKKELDPLGDHARTAIRRAQHAIERQFREAVNSMVTGQADGRGEDLFLKAGFLPMEEFVPGEPARRQIREVPRNRRPKKGRKR